MSECILWTGPSFETHGNVYGRVPGKKMVLAHRVAYENKFGTIPEELVIDHKCRNGLCINPDHLEAVTNIENVMRGEGAPARNARKIECYRGHELLENNLRVRKDGKRVCRNCEQDYRRFVRSGQYKSLDEYDLQRASEEAKAR